MNHSIVSDHSLSYSILILSIIYLSCNFFNISKGNEKILLIFPGIIGLMIGFGLIFQSIIVIVFLYIAKNKLAYMYESNSTDHNLEKDEEK